MYVENLGDPSKDVLRLSSFLFFGEHSSKQYSVPGLHGTVKENVHVTGLESMHQYVLTFSSTLCDTNTLSSFSLSEPFVDQTKTEVPRYRRSSLE